MAAPDLLVEGFLRWKKHLVLMPRAFVFQGFSVSPGHVVREPFVTVDTSGHTDVVLTGIEIDGVSVGLGELDELGISVDLLRPLSNDVILVCPDVRHYVYVTFHNKGEHPVALSLLVEGRQEILDLPPEMRLE